MEHQEQFSLTMDLLTRLQAKHSDQLLKGLQAQAKDHEAAVAAALAGVARPLSLPASENLALRKAACIRCRTPWFRTPEGRIASYCLGCGQYLSQGLI
jgi:hypothetical protein